MAGHSHAKNVMHRKAVQGAKRARAYGKLIREITVSAKTGMPDPAHNPRLRAAVKAALTANMTRDTIDRAIKRVAQGAAGENYEEVRYEGYGPHGIAVIVEALTDNRNRTGGDLRSIFAKNGGALGETNSVAFQFERKGVLRYPASAASADADSFEQVVYEGYGPSGVAVIVEALTDNRNRTAADVRAAFAKHDGNLGGSGAVAWLFERRGVILVDADRFDEDELTLAAAEGGADDVEQDGSSFRVTATPESLTAVREAIEAAGMEVESAELTMVPKTTVNLEDESAAKKTLKLIDALEENVDVQEVYANFDIPEQVMEAVAT